MKTPIEILSQLIRDLEELAKSTLTSRQTCNDLLETIGSYRIQIKSESFNIERICSAISDIYNEGNHAFELQPKLEQKYKLIRGHFEDAKAFVLEQTGNFTYPKKGKPEITGTLEL